MVIAGGCERRLSSSPRSGIKIGHPTSMLLAPDSHRRSALGSAMMGLSNRRPARGAGGGRRSRPRARHPQTQQTATHFDGSTRHVWIIDPAHPLYGRSFPLIRIDSPRGKNNVVILLPTGRRRSVPRAATDLDASASPSSSTLPRISVRTILPLAHRIQVHMRNRVEVSHDSSVIRAQRAVATATVATPRSVLLQPPAAVAPASSPATAPPGLPPRHLDSTPLCRHQPPEGDGQ